MKCANPIYCWMDFDTCLYPCNHHSNQDHVQGTCPLSWRVPSCPLQSVPAPQRVILYLPLPPQASFEVLNFIYSFVSDFFYLSLCKLTFYCCVRNHPKMSWLKTTVTSFPHWTSVQVGFREGGLSLFYAARAARLGAGWSISRWLTCMAG